MIGLTITAGTHCRRRERVTEGEMKGQQRERMIKEGETDE